MCKAFSCIVMRNGKTYWQAGIDSHDELISKFKVRDDTTDLEEISHAKIEIIPDNEEKYPYLYPEKPWNLTIDERLRPSWLLKMHEDNAWEAFNEWKKQVYQFNIDGALHPVNPLKIKKHKPSKEDILLLKEWDSVWASVRDSVGDSVGDSVRDSVGDSVGASVWASVWDSVWASVGALFPNITQWKYTEKIKIEGYPFKSAVKLWERGFIPSFYDNKWHLHSGRNASIVFVISKKDLMEVK